MYVDAKARLVSDPAHVDDRALLSGYGEVFEPNAALLGGKVLGRYPCEGLFRDLKPSGVVHMTERIDIGGAQRDDKLFAR